MATRPKVRAFLFCDAAVTDRASGKTTLVGIFEKVVAASYPASCDSPLQLIEHSGNLMGLELPAPGRYAVRLMYNGLVAEEFSLEAMEQP